MKQSKTIVLLFIIISLLSVLSRAAENGNALEKTTDNNTLDSIDNTIDKHLKRGENAEAMRSMLDKGKLLHQQGLYSNAVIVLDNAIRLSNDGKDTVKYPDMKVLYMECLNIKGGAYSYLSRYEDAIRCSIEMDKYNKDKNPVYKAKFYNLMGVVFAMNKKLDQAKGFYKQAIVITNSLEDSYSKSAQLFSTYSNLGGISVVKKEFDSAQIYLLESQRLAVYLKDKNKELVCLQLLGSLHANMNKFELAINYYNEAYELALQCNGYYMMTYLKMHLAKCYLALGNYEKARSLAFEGLEIARESKMKDNEIGILRVIANTYKQSGDINNAFKYLEESNVMKDSLFSQGNEERFLKQKTDFDMYKMSVEKEMFDKNMKLQESQRLVDKLVTLIIVLILVAASGLLTYKLMKQYRVNQLLKQEQLNLIDEKRIFQDEIEKKNREMSISSLSLAKNSELISLLIQKLKVLKSNFPLKGKGNEMMREVEELVIQLSKESYIGELNDCLKQIPSSFYDKLDILFPDMTMGEKRICGLMSFGLSAKDIATMMGKTTGAIGVVKFRIRKKINVDPEVDLCEYFFNLRE